MLNDSPTFFIVKNRALGDSIMGLSTISYIRSLYPKSTIIYAVPQWTAKLYSKIKTDADLIYPLKMDSISSILSLYTDLINLKVDVIHELHQSGTGKKVLGFFAALKDIPYTAHNHHLNSGTCIIDQGIKKELIQRDLDGIYSFYGKHFQMPSYLSFEPKFYFSSEVSPAKKERAIMGVVATRKTKMWPLENYVELANLFLDKYPNFEVVIPLSKSSEDLNIKSHLEKLISHPKIKISHIELDDLPLFFAESKLYVGNDTGLKHLAVAANIPSITMFGPEPIKEWHPYRKDKHIAFFEEHLACRTRTHHYCGLYECDLEENQNMQCLKKISPKIVLEKMVEKLNG